MVEVDGASPPVGGAPAESTLPSAAVVGGVEGGHNAPSDRLSWKARCREMQGLSRRRKGGVHAGASGRRRSTWNYSCELPVNEEFERYYRDQRVCPEGEWAAFMASNRSELPIAFRFNSCVPLWRYDIRQLLAAGRRHEQLELSPTVKRDQPHLALEPGASLFWHIKPSKHALRKDDGVVDFRKRLISGADRGILTRQETVSMLPVLYLDPQPHENILDLCAAPGMKYLQIVDAVQGALQYRLRESPWSNRGVIVANDVCKNRISTLGHHMKGMCCPSVTVTNYDASRFPYMYDSNGARVLFDRVLLDVPCSCDGTLRKAPELWVTWKASGGLAMHRLQLGILKRALQLLKPGGTLVYSTCSLNPLEDEAIASYVVSEGFREYGVVLEPLEPLEGFKTLTGLTEWLVPNPKGGYFHSLEEVPESLRDRVLFSMFPSSAWDAEQAQRVMRILPHNNDTGGFFLFKVRKPAAIPGPSSAPPSRSIRPEDVMLAAPNVARVANAKCTKLLHQYVRYSDCAPDMFDTMCRFYGIDGVHRDEFARLLVARHHVRSSCYLVSQQDASVFVFERKGRKLPVGGPAGLSAEVVPSGDVNALADGDAPATDDDDDVVDDTTPCSHASSVGSDRGFGCVRRTRHTWERCRYSLLGVRTFTRLESTATVSSPCVMRVAQDGALLLVDVLQRRLVFANMAFCADVVKVKIQPQRLLEHEREGNISSLDCCRREGVLESGGCVVVVVPPWGHGRIPAHGVSATMAGGIVVSAEPGEGSPSGREAVSVPDIMDTMPMACVLSDEGHLFSYATPQVLDLLRSLVDEC